MIGNSWDVLLYGAIGLADILTLWFIVRSGARLRDVPDGLSKSWKAMKIILKRIAGA